MNNNCLYNAALIGFCASNNSWLISGNATEYTAFKNAAVAFATQVDSKIPFDALVTTASNNATMLVDTASNTIQSNTQMRPALLQQICQAVMEGRYESDAAAQVASYWDTIATRIAALYTAMLAGLVSP
jgi:hypothetical protein